MAKKKGAIRKTLVISTPFLVAGLAGSILADIYDNAYLLVGSLAVGLIATIVLSAWPR